MRINHNIAALNTHRQLTGNTNGVQKSLEKLSSGLRINRAGDDAAGLAISEKMRGQIRGLDMATKNAQDGISLIQTAEGALNETHSILQRMRELSVQSSNDTNTDTDRAELQKEVDQLTSALNDIAANTEFNTQKLLNGTFKNAVFHVGANKGQNLEVSVNEMSADELKVATAYTVGEGGKIEGLAYKEAAVAGEKTTTTAATFGIEAQTVPGVDDGTFSYKDAAGDTKTATWKAAADGNSAGYYNGTELIHEVAAAYATATDVTLLAKAATEATTVTTKVPATVGGYYDGDTLRIEGAKLAEGTKGTLGINISSQEDADKAITTIQSAIDSVSAERSKLGAVQNRLDHTINNLGTSAENITAAESRIRDVDMAKEMMEFTKNNILTQAAQSMLAQANQTPQGVLQLLQ